MEILHLYAFRYRLFCEYTLGKMVTSVESELLENGQKAAVFFDRNYKILKTELLNCAVTISAEMRKNGLSEIELRRDFAVMMLETLDLFRSIHHDHEMVFSDLDVSDNHPSEQ